MSQKQEGKLRKEIGVFGGVSLVAGMTIGSGIYYLGSYVLERTNMTQGAALLCWIIGGIISILGGLCFAELGAEIYGADRRGLQQNDELYPRQHQP